MYRERLVVDKRVTVRAAAGADVTLEWVVDRPYESAVVVPRGGSLALAGVAVRHASPSVANDFAVHVPGGSLSMAGCRVTSASGAGVCVEGGSADIADSAVVGCVDYGVSALADVEGARASLALSRCAGEGRPPVVPPVVPPSPHPAWPRPGPACGAGPRTPRPRPPPAVERNGGDGVAAIGADVSLVDCVLSGNGGAGVRLRDASVLAFDRVDVRRGNRGGGVARGPSVDGLAP